VVKDLPTIVGSVAGLAGATGALAVGIAVLRRPAEYLSAGHALVGSDVDDPLPEVLRRRLGGLTVPVRPGPHGELFLGTGIPEPGRTLRRLVLNPLFARAQSRGGRLYRDQRVPFQLVVHVVGSSGNAAMVLRAYRMLDQQLRDHAPLVSRSIGNRQIFSAVTVAVTGIADIRELLAAQSARYAFADGAFEDIGSSSAPPALVPMISEQWTRRFGWDGLEPIVAEERHLLHAMVRAAHADGRTVRISGLPSGSRSARRAIWDELRLAGVDVIADADQRGLASYLRGQPISRGPEVRTVAVRQAPLPRGYPAVEHERQVNDA
jgi:hypothetical protein